MVLMNIPASPVLSGALVGGGVAGLVGIAAWAFISIFNGAVTGAAADAVRFAWTELPHAALGGVAGGFLAGMAMAAVGFGWSEDA